MENFNLPATPVTELVNNQDFLALWLAVKSQPLEIWRNKTTLALGPLHSLPIAQGDTIVLEYIILSTKVKVIPSLPITFKA